MNILIYALLSDEKLMSKLQPLAELEMVRTIYLIRRDPFVLDKVRTYCPPALFRLNNITLEFYRLFIGTYLCLFKRIDIIMGIYILWHGVLAWALGKLFGKPVIQNLIGDEFLLWQRNEWMKRIILSADAIITRGDVTRSQLIEIGMKGNRIFPIPNVFDFHKVPPAPKKAKQFDLIYTGSLTPLKRIDILIDAVYLVKVKYGLYTSVAIIGDGPLQATCRKHIRRLDMENQFTFFGYQNDIYNYLHQARIFIMTSEHEGFPMSMVEAMACGLPCIMPDVSNIPTVAIHGHNALLAPVGKPETFATHIHSLLTDEALYKRLAGNALQIRDEKAREYSVEAITSRWRLVLARFAD